MAKIKKVKKTKEIEKEKDEDEIVPEKIKKSSFEFELPDPVVPEKIDDAEVAEDTNVGDDEESDALELDDEELNPFKDKWEE